jgi:hypothetical protein
MGLLRHPIGACRGAADDHDGSYEQEPRDWDEGKEHVFGAAEIDRRSFGQTLIFVLSDVRRKALTALNTDRTNVHCGGEG